MLITVQTIQILNFLYLMESIAKTKSYEMVLIIWDVLQGKVKLLISDCALGGINYGIQDYTDIQCAVLG